MYHEIFSILFRTKIAKILLLQTIGRNLCTGFTASSVKEMMYILLSWQDIAANKNETDNVSMNVKLKRFRATVVVVGRQ
jgi:hypothetical protein